jgi:hypothetical protein
LVAHGSHIRHHKVPQREITERKNPREHKKKHMQWKKALEKQ